VLIKLSLGAEYPLVFVDKILFGVAISVASASPEALIHVIDGIP
jgi:hypothetical protein